MATSAYTAVFGNRRIAAVLLLGFASGLPLALTTGTLQAWLSDAGLDVKTIGWFTLVGQPYTWKFLWAPLMDRLQLPWLGRRRGWIALAQLALALALALMAGLDPAQHLMTFAVLALLVAFFSATQDIALDAWRTELLPGEERGAGAAVGTLGYRLAMLTSGALALILADHFLSWQGVYQLMAALMALMVLSSIWAPEPQRHAPPPRTLQAAVLEPLQEFFSRTDAWPLLLLVVLYKLGDAFAGSLTTKFLLDMGYSKTIIGEVNKLFGLVATLAGGALGGALMVRWSLFKSLLVFGLLQAITNLGYWWLASQSHGFIELVLAIGLENLAGGMGTVASVALLMTLCDVRYTATQYALLSALAAVGRVYVGPASGYLVDAVGWSAFFLCSIALAMPGLWLLQRLRPTLRRLEQGK